ncbi:MAG: hypothetical protein JO040_07950 [Gemmatimonadetes bacterium]|nr:hypothetical protein [Gemmatimonadota bacterium]
MSDHRRSTSLRLLVWLFLLALGVEHGAAVTREARSESKSSFAVARIHGARAPTGRFLPDPPQSVALPGTGTELPPLGMYVVLTPAPDRHPAPPTPVVWRAEYPRGPPRAA